METKIKSCPFCGSKDVGIIKDKIRNLWKIECDRCYASMEIPIKDETEDDRDKTIEYWNCRNESSYETYTVTFRDMLAIHSFIETNILKEWYIVSSKIDFDARILTIQYKIKAEDKNNDN